MGTVRDFFRDFYIPNEGGALEISCFIAMISCSEHFQKKTANVLFFFFFF